MTKQIMVASAFTWALLSSAAMTGCSSSNKLNPDATMLPNGFGAAGNSITGTGSGGTSSTAGSTSTSMGTGGTGGHSGMDAGSVTTPPKDAGMSCVAASCANGACCDGMCTDTKTDHVNCGACGSACQTTERCTDGSCKPLMCSGTPGNPVNDIDGGDSPADVIASNGCPPNEVCIDGSAGGECHCGSGSGCPVDESCSSGGSCMCGNAAGCNTGENCCGDSCLNLQTDNDNCGVCGKTCSGPVSCHAGRCTCPTAGDKLCGDTCVDTATDEHNCGKCGTTCATGATCLSGTCTCDVAGQVECHGRCVALATSDNCSMCDESCAAPSTCRDPSGSRPLGCYCPNVNDVACNGACVSLGTVDNCGSCGDACAAPATTCRNQRCQCPNTGDTACGDSCVNLQTGVVTGGSTPITNCGACGVTCLANATCTAGVCSCPNASNLYCDQDPVTGATDGQYACIPVTTTKNCGDCGNACLDDSQCRVSGNGSVPADYSCACIGSDAGKTHCKGEGCKDLNTDEADCGACGHACPSGVTCRGGACDCPGAASVRVCTVDNAPLCVDVNTDAKNCGQCGTACAAGDDCCGGNCVNPDSAYNTDRANCGSCGNACGNVGCGFLGLGRCNCTNGACN